MAKFRRMSEATTPKKRRRRPAEDESEAPQVSASSRAKKITGVNIRRVQKTVDGLSGMFFKPKEGRSILRILPPTEIYAGDFAIQQAIHYLKDAGEQKTVACLASKEVCPLCEFAATLSNSGSKDDTKLARDIGVSNNFLTEVVLMGKGNDKRIRLYRMPSGVYKTLAEGLVDYGDFTDPKTGRNIILRREGTGMQTKYTVVIKDQSPIPARLYKRGRLNLQKLLAPKVSAKAMRKIIREHFEG